MQYRQIPKTGDRLSILGFGCMRLPQKKGKPGDGRIDKPRAQRQIHQAIEKGVNYFDTAMPYHMGGSEAFLGEVLSNGHREKVRIATKLPPWSVKQPEDMDRILSVQLERLRTDRIDYYLLHNLLADNWEKLQRLDVLAFLDRARKQGRIVNAGFSFHGDKETFKQIVDAYDWEFCQIQYNFLDTLHQAGTEGLNYAAERGLGVIIMEPLRGGSLAGTVPPRVQALWDSAATRRTPAQWALRWVWHHPAVTVVLSGMNEEAHIEENIATATAAGPLTDEEAALILQVEQTYRRLMKAGCTACNYCMPCPSGVNIPGCFELYNSFHMFNDRAVARVRYLGTLYGAMGFQKACASLCKKCGKCEKKCPQGLPIQALLEDVVRTFETRGQKIMAYGMGIFSSLQRRSTVQRAKRVTAQSQRDALSK